MAERPLDELAATLSNELQRFLKPQANGAEPGAERPGIKAEPIIQLLMTAAARAQDNAQRKAEEARRTAADATPAPAAADMPRRELEQLAARVDALTEQNRALERQLARLEGYVEGLRAQIAPGRKD